MSMVCVTCRLVSGEVLGPLDFEATAILADVRDLLDVMYGGLIQLRLVSSTGKLYTEQWFDQVPISMLP